MDDRAVGPGTAQRARDRVCLQLAMQLLRKPRIAMTVAQESAIAQCFTGHVTEVSDGACWPGIARHRLRRSFESVDEDHTERMQAGVIRIAQRIPRTDVGAI